MRIFVEFKGKKLTNFYLLQSIGIKLYTNIKCIGEKKTWIPLWRRVSCSEADDYNLPFCILIREGGLGGVVMTNNEQKCQRNQT